MNWDELYNLFQPFINLNIYLFVYLKSEFQRGRHRERERKEEGEIFYPLVCSPKCPEGQGGTSPMPGARSFNAWVCSSVFLMSVAENCVRRGAAGGKPEPIKDANYALHDKVGSRPM